MNRRASLGARSETRALTWLKSHGLACVTRNFSCRYGELDLIMDDAGTLVVVEVRARSSARFMSPELSIDHRKRHKIIRSTEFFLQQHPLYANNAVRFDVVALTGDETGNVCWIRDAFTVD